MLINSLTKGFLHNTASRPSSFNCKSFNVLSKLIMQAHPIVDEGATESTIAKFARGMRVQLRVTRYGHIGASIETLNKDINPTTGMILRNEIDLFLQKRGGEDIFVGEELEGFVDRVRDDGKLDISLRPPLISSRIKEVRDMILNALEGSPTYSIPVGDKSLTEDIARYFHGISKRDFKMAVGSLFKEALCVPGEYETKFIPEDERKVKTKDETAKPKKVMKPPRLPVDRKVETTVFIGNLPFRVSIPALTKFLDSILGSEIIKDIRVVIDADGNPKGYAYIELTDEGSVEDSIKKLNNVSFQKRTLRADYGDPSRSNQYKVKDKSAPTSSSLTTTAAVVKSAVDDAEERRIEGIGGRGEPNSGYSVIDDIYDSDDSANADAFNAVENTSDHRVLKWESKTKESVIRDETGRYDESSQTLGGSERERLGRDNDQWIEDQPDVFVERDSRVSRNSRQEMGAGSTPSPRVWRSGAMLTDTIETTSTRDDKGWVKSALADINRNKRRQEQTEGRVRSADFGRVGSEVVGQYGSERRDRSFTSNRSVGGPPTRGTGARGGAPATLFVGNLSFQATKELLHEEVQKYCSQGAVRSVRLASDPETGRSRGFAYVDLASAEDAEKVYNTMHNMEFLGRRFNVNEAAKR